MPLSIKIKEWLVIDWGFLWQWSNKSFVFTHCKRHETKVCNRTCTRVHGDTASSQTLCSSHTRASSSTIIFVDARFFTRHILSRVQAPMFLIHKIKTQLVFFFNRFCPLFSVLRSRFKNHAPHLIPRVVFRAPAKIRNQGFLNLFDFAKFVSAELRSLLGQSILVTKTVTMQCSKKDRTFPGKSLNRKYFID